MSKTIWLLDTGKSDPKAFATYELGEQAFIKSCDSGDTLDEIAKDLEQWDVWYEFQPGTYLAVDDGPHLFRIEYYD